MIVRTPFSASEFLPLVYCFLVPDILANVGEIDFRPGCAFG